MKSFIVILFLLSNCIIFAQEYPDNCDHDPCMDQKEWISEDFVISIEELNTCILSPNNYINCSGTCSEETSTITTCLINIHYSYRLNEGDCPDYPDEVEFRIDFIAFEGEHCKDCRCDWVEDDQNFIANLYKYVICYISHSEQYIPQTVPEYNGTTKYFNIYDVTCHKEIEDSEHLIVPCNYESCCIMKVETTKDNLGRIQAHWDIRQKTDNDCSQDPDPDCYFTCYPRSVQGPAIISNVDSRIYKVNSELKIFPNPTNGDIIFEISNYDYNNLEIKLFDNVGIRVLNKNFNKNNSNQYIINTSKLVSGNYHFIVYIDGERFAVEQFIIEK
jgi:hypothetical protein